MTNSHPPRVALWLLERFAADNEPLIGDLVEQFEMKSRWWFWRQVLAAILMARLNRSREIRPLRLVDREPGELPAHCTVHARRVNLTASPVYGVGGLGLLSLAVLISVVVPHMWWVMLAVVLNGILLGMAWALITRPKAKAGATGILFGGDPEPRQPGHDPQANA